ncbi:G-protein coupled receptor frpr-1 [Biomphalaria glabrata]|nr:putative G-protein coupled receptor frpr-1 [Biomphalaria glabrata]
MNQSEDLVPGDKVTEFDETLANVNYFLNVWLLMILSLVGVVANSLTIAVLRQQGWKEGVNISMMVISVLDLVRCLLTIFKGIHGFIEIVSPSDGVSWSNLTTPNAEFLNVLTNYVTFAMLAYVSLERCLCVTLPFTMKSVFNHKVTITTLTMTAASVYGMFIVLFLNFDLEAVFSANFNATIIILVHSRFYHTHSAIVDPYLNIMSMLHPTLCFIILCISSVVILKQLQKSRDTFSSNKKKDLVWNRPPPKTETLCLRFSKREKRVTKMLLVVMVVYIGNLAPRVTWYAWQIFQPEFRPLGRLNDLFMLSVTAMFILDLLHASVNFFIFYSLSSGFKKTFDALWT